MFGFRGDLFFQKRGLFTSDLFFEFLNVEKHDPRAVVGFAVILNETLIRERRGQRLLTHEVQILPKTVNFFATSIIEQQAT